MGNAKHRVIFDTDIGTDVDDILALAVLLGSDDVTIEGVTTVYGDVDLRARMVSKLLNLRGIDSVPVCSGIRNPLLNLDPIFWPGHEGVGLLEEVDTDASPLQVERHAVDYIIQTVMQNSGEMTLLAVGPLTNIAVALVREPALASSLKRLVIMGGRLGIPAGTRGMAEHNIKCDPESAHNVLSSGAPIELVPLDVTLRAIVRQDGVEKLHDRKSPYHSALATQLALYPGFIERGGETFLHDPLAALAVVRPDLLTWTELPVAVALHGSATRGMTYTPQSNDALQQSTISVALELDIPACEQEILSRMCR
ncbi:MAG: nucleoside hydrolase [Thermomicrobiales bacterium]